MEFVNAREMAANHPKTFCVPTEKEMEDLKPGDFVKVCLNEERFWCEVVHFNKETEAVTGFVSNELLFSDLSHGDEIVFKFENVYDILKP